MDAHHRALHSTLHPIVRTTTVTKNFMDSSNRSLLSHDAARLGSEAPCTVIRLGRRESNRNGYRLTHHKREPTYETMVPFDFHDCVRRASNARGMKVKQNRCPRCQRVLVNRLVDYCLYCGEAIPVEMQLTDQEKAMIMERQKDQIESERRLRKENEAEERMNAERDDGLDVTDFLF